MSTLGWDAESFAIAYAESHACADFDLCELCEQCIVCCTCGDQP